MTIAEIIMIGIALSMDAVAVGMTDGMLEPRMGVRKRLLIAGFFGAFQFLMPVLGYYGSSAFSGLIERVAPYVSFALLVLLGGKMIAEGAKREERSPFRQRKTLGAGKLAAQAFATSIDALAVGISLLAQDVTVGLPLPAALCALVIGGVTFVLSLAAVELGRAAGNRFSDGAELLGGVILVAIGLKILLEGI